VFSCWSWGRAAYIVSVAATPFELLWWSQRTILLVCLAIHWMTAIDPDCRLAQAHKDMAELNSRLVDAAFGNAFSAGVSDFTPSASGLDREDSTLHLDRDSSNPAASSSGEQTSLMGLPPGVPLDPFYDE